MNSERHRINLATIVSIALAAFALQPVAHEVVGHAVTAWLTGTKIILISSTAMQTEGGGRIIPASGPLANVVFGIAAYLAFRRISRFSAARLFLWIFAFANLFIGTGYILFSGVMNFGDAAAVIAGLRPAWLYRVALVAIGAWGYRFCAALAARDMADLVGNGSIRPEDVGRMLYAPCVAGAVLYVVASFFNPVGPSLILYDGVSSACGIAVGLLLVPGIVHRSSKALAAPLLSPSANPVSIPFRGAWLVVAFISSFLFIFFLGRGIRP